MHGMGVYWMRHVHLVTREILLIDNLEQAGFHLDDGVQHLTALSGGVPFTEAALPPANLKVVHAQGLENLFSSPKDLPFQLSSAGCCCGSCSQEPLGGPRSTLQSLQ